MKTTIFLAQMACLAASIIQRTKRRRNLTIASASNSSRLYLTLGPKLFLHKAMVLQNEHTVPVYIHTNQYKSLAKYDFQV